MTAVSVVPALVFRDFESAEVVEYVAQFESIERGGSACGQARAMLFEDAAGGAGPIDAVKWVRVFILFAAITAAGFTFFPGLAFVAGDIVQTAPFAAVLLPCGAGLARFARIDRQWIEVPIDVVVNDSSAMRQFACLGWRSRTRGGACCGTRFAVFWPSTLEQSLQDLFIRTGHGGFDLSRRLLRVDR